MTKCPYCAESIADDASRCHHCDSSLGPDGSAVPNEQPRQPQNASLSSPTEAIRGNHRRARFWAAGAGAVVLLALGVGGVLLYAARTTQGEQAPRDVSPPVVAAPPVAPRRELDERTKELLRILRFFDETESEFCDSVLRRDRALSQEQARYCGFRSSPEILPEDARDGLARALISGRTDAKGRAAFKDFLRSRGINRVSGWIVALVGADIYEAAWTRISYDWGIRVPAGKHFLLKATRTRFETTGTFKKWVMDLGTESITTKRGSVEEWNVFIESELGEAYQEILRAPAGYQTRVAIRNFAKGLAADALAVQVEGMNYTEADLVGR